MGWGGWGIIRHKEFYLSHEVDDLLVVFAVVGHGADAVVDGGCGVAHQDTVLGDLGIRFHAA